MKKSKTKMELSKSVIAIVFTFGAFNINADTNLRLAHFWPAESMINQKIFKEWARSVENETGGEVNVQIFPSDTLTKSNKAYQGAVQGVSDIAITAQGYTAGRFPLTQLVELPGMVNSAKQGSCIVQTLYDQGAIADEYKDSHVLFMFTNGPGILHMKNTEVTTPSDLDGLRVRRPTAVVGEMLDEMGAQPIGMPMPEVYTALQRGVMDGLTTSWEGVKVFGLNDVVTSHTQVPLYTLTFVATMNKKTYEGLSSKAREAIDNNSGMMWADVAGNVFDQIDYTSKESAKELGHHVNVISDPHNDSEWSSFMKSGIDSYLARLKEIDVDNIDSVYSDVLKVKESCTSL